MPKAPQKSLALLAIIALVVGLSACGDSEKTIATVGKSKVSQSMLSHWMNTVIGGDYTAALLERAPEGLVSDPPRYDRCVKTAEGVERKFLGKVKLSKAQLLLKCRQLNAATREQALSYIISVLWRTEEAAELGAPISQGDVNKALRYVIYKQSKGPANFRRMLSHQLRTIADERFLLQRNILAERFLTRLKARAKELGGDEQQNLAKLARANNAKWTARTSCAPGYRAWQCKQAASLPEAPLSPAVLLERLSRGQA
jgi:hypothetical protein